jgi:Lipocalin-like domain
VPTDLAGVWRLVAWRRIASDGTVSHPLGDDAQGMLVYTPNGRMAVQLTAAGRAPLKTDDPLGGDVNERAEAYSTCLAYVGRYEVRDDTVVHTIDASLYPNWSGAEQSRPFTFEDDELVLRTPPMETAAGTVINELAWAREG